MSSKEEMKNARHITWTEADNTIKVVNDADREIARQIIDWSRQRGYYVRDAVAVAFHMGHCIGKYANAQRVAKAFKKMYPRREEAPADLAADVDALMRDIFSGEPAADQSGDTSTDVNGSGKMPVDTYGE